VELLCGGLVHYSTYLDTLFSYTMLVHLFNFHLPAHMAVLAAYSFLPFRLILVSLTQIALSFSIFVLFVYKCRADGFHLCITKYEPVMNGINMKIRSQSKSDFILNSLSSPKTSGAIPHNPSTTMVDHALNLSPPIYPKYISELTYSPRPNNPIKHSPN
jgi:hypothetical protein